MVTDMTTYNDLVEELRSDLTYPEKSKYGGWYWKETLNNVRHGPSESKIKSLNDREEWITLNATDVAFDRVGN